MDLAESIRGVPSRSFEVSSRCLDALRVDTLCFETLLSFHALTIEALSSEVLMLFEVPSSEAQRNLDALSFEAPRPGCCGAARRWASRC